MEALGAMSFVFGMLGVVAFVRTQKLIKILKANGVLDKDYKSEQGQSSRKNGPGGSVISERRPCLGFLAGTASCIFIGYEYRPETIDLNLTFLWCQ